MIRLLLVAKKFAAIVSVLVGLLGFDIAYGGEIVNHQLESAALAENLIGENPTRSFSVYLPDGYSEVNDRYPVVYWFPGFGRTPLQEISRASIDEAIQTGRIPPVVIVFMSVVTRFEATLYLNSDAFGNWEDFLVSEVIPFIDDTYQTYPAPRKESA